MVEEREGEGLRIIERIMHLVVGVMNEKRTKAGGLATEAKP